MSFSATGGYRTLPSKPYRNEYGSDKKHFEAIQAYQIEVQRGQLRSFDLLKELSRKAEALSTTFQEGENPPLAQAV
jgi:hypothetical protein